MSTPDELAAVRQVLVDVIALLRAVQRDPLGTQDDVRAFVARLDRTQEQVSNRCNVPPWLEARHG